MTGHVTGVSAFGADDRARLGARAGTHSFVARRLTRVASARQRFSASFTAAHLGQMARHVFAQLVLAVAQLLAQDNTRGARLFRVAIVTRIVAARATSTAWFTAFSPIPLVLHYDCGTATGFYNT